MSNHETTPAPTVQNFGLNGWAVSQAGRVLSPQFRTEAGAVQWLEAFRNHLDLVGGAQ